MNTDDGTPAFPGWAKNHYTDPNPRGGMSLRDYFAAQALSGIEASQGNGGNFISTADKVAARSYELADAMLVARAG